MSTRCAPYPLLTFRAGHAAVKCFGSSRDKALCFVVTVHTPTGSIDGRRSQLRGGLQSFGEEGEDASALLAAGGDGGEDAFDEAAASVALAAVVGRTPADGVADRPRGVVDSFQGCRPASWKCDRIVAAMPRCGRAVSLCQTRNNPCRMSYCLVDNLNL